ncbi:carboxymuconolactone decarboxylase family protein [Candidatus Parabeggiatoa sp. HSG14]|uniref:carboxymuconolactone decarboxylase family protein n=1 Tax=Candidatus Parabeggiatoa sp. HSG14 TaxID=3055593 RepID=UPI0025A79583|nr:carboxymuconolactone decarboxylase family protein [Thiotrichales bacterium HSG14]
MRVSAKSLNKYPWYLRPFFWNQKRKYKKILKPALLWGRVPQLFATVALLYGALDRKSSPLSPVLRSLVTVRVSQINWCHFCVDINNSLLLKRSGSMEKLEALKNWKESDQFDDLEKVVLEYTEAITYSDRQVTDDLMKRIHDFFDDDGIVELTGLIAFQNLSSKFNSALDVPPQGFCQVPADNEKTLANSKLQTQISPINLLDGGTKELKETI